MSKADEYRRNAEECSRMAQATRNPEDKAAWLRLADSWLRMLRPDAVRAPGSMSGFSDRQHDAHQIQH